MSFYIDKQTLKDLDIFNDNRNVNSVLDLFNVATCTGGKEKICEFLSKPLSDAQEITERSDAIKYFYDNQSINVEMDQDALNFAEFYQKQKRDSYFPTWFSSVTRQLVDKVNNEAQYYLMSHGAKSTIKVLKSIFEFSTAILNASEENKIPKLLVDRSKEALAILHKNGYDKLIHKKKISRYQIAILDYQFRYTERRDILFFLDLIHEYDAYSALARVAKERGFSFAEMTDAENDNKIEIKGLFHPLLENAVANDLTFCSDSNVIFLSGPNMAGKSTILKALSVAIYLAHVGFPVSASSLNMGVLSGLCTTINISDNLSSGYSHFYAEVMRIKDVALKLREHKRMLVIFDELFRGTNVKDAYDGTCAIIKAFAKVKDSFFIVSTHIVEVAEELKDIQNVKFNYLDIEKVNGEPAYTYKLREGVSENRLGMYIIEKEGVIELINGLE